MVEHSWGPRRMLEWVLRERLRRSWWDEMDKAMKLEKHRKIRNSERKDDQNRKISP